MKKISCPNCGASGKVNDEGLFEVRGKVDGTPVRKCLSCGAGLLIRALGKPSVIPSGSWSKMEAEWNREFGASKIDSLLEATADDLASRLEKRSSVPSVLKVLFAFAGHSARAPLSWIFASGKHEFSQVADLTASQASLLLHVSMCVNVYLFLGDDENRAALCSALECEDPTLDRLVSENLARSIEGANPRSGIPGDLLFPRREPSSVAVSFYRLARPAVLGSGDDADILEVMGYFAAFTSNFQALDRAFWTFVQS